jgi:hypothetical protein
MKHASKTPQQFREVLTIDESQALAVLGQIDTPANRSALRAKLPHTGPAHSPRYYDADVRTLARTGVAPTGTRGNLPDMRR